MFQKLFNIFFYESLNVPKTLKLQIKAGNPPQMETRVKSDFMYDLSSHTNSVVRVFLVGYF